MANKGKAPASGARRVSFTLTAADAAALERLRVRWGCSWRAEAARRAVALACDRPAGGPRYAARLARGERRRLERAADVDAAAVRWNQHVLPADMRMLRRLMGRRGLASLSEALRYAVRAADQGGDDGDPGDFAAGRPDGGHGADAL